MSLCKALAIVTLVFFSFSLFLFNHPTCQTDLFTSFHHIWDPPLSSSSSVSSSQTNSTRFDSLAPTNISHIVFGIVGSVNGWRNRKTYIESWWKPNINHGYLFLDVAPPEDLLPWPNSSPPYRISEDNGGILKITHHNPTMVRIARGISETFREVGEKGGLVRWIVMGDDDSIFFLENMVEVLGKYDHTEYVYIGGHSESVLPNFIHSFEMGFGGAGVVFSYPLAAALVPRLDECIKRYPMLYAADQMWQSCLADLGVYLSPEKGIHQIDLHDDISGLLSSHPQAPLLSLHHPEQVEPFFPNMDRHQSVKHLMKAAKVDQSRLLQQTICYHRESNWSISVSWGYSTHIYEKIYPKSILQKPLETFGPWVRNANPPFFTFNTRVSNRDPCEAPHVFFFESINNGTNSEGWIRSTYARVTPRGLPTCSISGTHSADGISRIRVTSPSKKLTQDKSRRECCDIVYTKGSDIADIKYRPCVKNEIIA